jgi:hypothetical protein
MRLAGLTALAVAFAASAALAAGDYDRQTAEYLLTETRPSCKDGR